MITTTENAGIITPVTLSREVHAMAESAAAMLGVQIPDLLRAGLIRALVEFETTGTLAVMEDQPVPLLEAKTARRMAEVDGLLEITAGEGVAETVLGNLITEMMGGDFGLIMNGWTFEDEQETDEAEADLRALVEKWEAEDEPPPAPADASMTSPVVMS